MEIWLDTTNKEAIKEADAMGLLYGVTTNPSIASASGVPLEKLLTSLLEIQKGPVAAQVVAEDFQAMVEQGRTLRKLSSRIIIKVPATAEGYKCMRKLILEGIPVLATTIFEAKQALLSFIEGAAYLAPYIGRIRDTGQDPKNVLQDILAIKHNYGFTGKILGAGIRNVEDMMCCATIGICSITIPEKVFRELLKDHDGVRKSLDEFNKDWEKRKYEG